MPALVQHNIARETGRMALLGSVSSKQVDEFARSLVAEVVKHYPPSPSAEGARKASQRKVASVLEDVLRKASDFGKQHKLGIYKKARLGNTVRWELKELGYSDEFAEALVKDLVFRLSVK
jgi:hypothetical protein